jgi:hypothetical protein
VSIYGIIIEGLGARRSHEQKIILQERETHFSKFMLQVSEMKLPG